MGSKRQTPWKEQNKHMHSYQCIHKHLNMYVHGKCATSRNKRKNEKGVVEEEETLPPTQTTQCYLLPCQIFMPDIEPNFLCLCMWFIIQDFNGSLVEAICLHKFYVQMVCEELNWRWHIILPLTAEVEECTSAVWQDTCILFLLYFHCAAKDAQRTYMHKYKYICEGGNSILMRQSDFFK